MKRIASLSLAVVAMAVFPVHAYAQATTIGERVGSIVTDLTGPFIFLLSIGALVGGLALLGKGLVKLKDASGNNAEVGSAMLTILAAVILIALPEAAGTGMMTITQQSGIISAADIRAAKVGLDDSGSGEFNVGDLTAADVTNCYTSEKAVPCIAKNIATNVVPVGIQATFILVFIAGLWGLAGTLFSLTKVQGGRGLPEGFWGKIVFNLLLLNASLLFQFTSQTLMGKSGTVGGNGLNDGSSLLTYDIGAGEKFAQYQEMIGYIFVILALFGAFAFVRGIFVMKSAGEGKQGSSYGHGIVFMVAGILLANAKFSTCTVLSTMGVGTIGFC